MKILSVAVMRGPNYWSTYRQQLIVLKLDLEGSENFPTNTIDGFQERLEALIPSLYEHRCFENKPGGFFERVRKGTGLDHVIEHVALELQSLAGMPCGFGRAKPTGKKGISNVIFSYQVENAGKYAAEAAVRIVQTLESNIPYDIAHDIKALMKINKEEGLGPSTQSLINEAKRRNIPYRRLNKESLIMFGHGVHQKIVCATMACTTSSVGVDLASDKEQTRRILSSGFIPVPEGRVISTEEELMEVISEVGFPLVIKPLNGNQGKGVTTNINSRERAIEAFATAKQMSEDVIAERFISGLDYRFLVINYKLEAVARRTPAMVVGDDRSTIEQLIVQTNSDPNRGEGHEKVLTTIKVDARTNSILVEKNLTLNSVLPFGEILFLKDTANLSTGGTARDVTDVVHPYNVFMVERIARLMNLDICGIDIIAQDISTPITAETGGVLEVNAAPGFRMHLSPTKGTARNVAEPVMRMLFPEGSRSRIPIVAVTGTNGKTTTTRLVAHLAKQAGHTVGYTTTDGIYIQGQAIYYGDCSGPSSAEAVLRDPIVDFAVLECARGGILRSGLGFDKCDISIITNVTDDHLGLNDINTLEELAKVKSVVARSTSRDGYAILNADDDLVYAMRKEVDCSVALFSVQENSERIQAHCDEGGWAAIVEKGYFTLCKGEWRIRIAKVKEVPLTLDGRATCMISNILPAILAASIRGFEAKTIRKALQSFVPGPQLTPGRMNIFHFRCFDLMIDYAHNTDGFAQAGKFMEKVEASSKIGIVGCPGDRRDEDIINMGYHAAAMFDTIIIRHDKDPRGRTNEEITQLIRKGIDKTGKKPEIIVISDEWDAIRYAMQHACNGAFIVVFTDTVQATLDFVSKAQEEDIKASGMELTA
ncbi:MAG TPA: cyanophycin synthetase [Chitinophagaceae bacterium]|nr:cyanophycin synthetase [Chitinophagaceae bacterium]